MKRSSKCLKGFFYIEGKLKLVSNNFMEIQMGEGWVFELGNPEGRGAQAVLEIQVRGGGKKTVPSVVGVWIFSGITQCRLKALLLIKESQNMFSW